MSSGRFRPPGRLVDRKRGTLRVGSVKYRAVVGPTHFARCTARFGDRLPGGLQIGDGIAAEQRRVPTHGGNACRQFGIRYWVRPGIVRPAQYVSIERRRAVGVAGPQ